MKKPFNLVRDFCVTTCLAASLMVPSMSVNAEQVVKLTSLEWPPYTSEGLPDQGASVAVARQAFAAMGYKLEVEFFPWKRAVALAQNDPGFVGYFPEYYAAETEKTFTFSDPMGDSPLGFAERADKQHSWSTLDDLKPLRIGTVYGYVNTEDFDAMVASGALKADAANSDDKNLQKLNAGRIDLAVIDQNVMNHLLKFQFPDMKDSIVFNAKPLEVKKLYICFRKSESGDAAAKVFNEGLKKIDVQKIMSDYFAGLK